MLHGIKLEVAMSVRESSLLTHAKGHRNTRDKSNEFFIRRDPNANVPFFIITRWFEGPAMALILVVYRDKIEGIPFEEFGTVLEAEGSLVILDIIQ